MSATKDTCTNCKGTGLDPRANGEFVCPDCPAPAPGLRDQIAAAILAELTPKRRVGLMHHSSYELPITASPEDARRHQAGKLADAVLAVPAIRQMQDRLAEYENALNWHTTCLACARVLNSGYRETVRAEEAETALALAHEELAALKEVARGYCPECGRGDAAPTVEDWLRERQRAKEAEAKLDALGVQED